MKKFVFIALLFCGCSSSKHLDNARHVTSWQDEFNEQKSFNETYWSKIPRGSSDWNRHMSNYDSLYTVRNGNLVLRGILNNGQVTDTSNLLQADYSRKVR